MNLTKNQKFITKWAFVVLTIIGGAIFYNFSMLGPGKDIVDCIITSGFIAFMAYLLVFD